MFGYKLTHKGRTFVGFVVYFIMLVAFTILFWQPYFILFNFINLSCAVIWLVASWDEDYEEDYWSSLSWYGNVSVYFFAFLIIPVMLMSDSLKKWFSEMIEQDVRKKKRKNEDIISEQNKAHFDDRDFVWSVTETTYKISEDGCDHLM